MSVEEPVVMQGQPELVGKPAAARGKSCVMNPTISPKVIVNVTREGSAATAAKAAVPPEKGSRGSLPGLGSSSAARQTAAESTTPPPGAAQGPATAVVKEENECWWNWRVPEEEENLASWTISDLP